MSYKVIKRPKLSPGEHCYVQALVGGLWITLKHLVLALVGKSRGKKMIGGSGMGVTMQFPEHRWDKHLPDYYRGMPTLVKGADNVERCVSCQLCEFICPPRAIKITPGAVSGKREKGPATFEIDMLRCIYCGLCQEVCPEQAIILGQEYLLTPRNRTAGVHNKEKLYTMGGVQRGLINKWNAKK